MIPDCSATDSEGKYVKQIDSDCDSDAQFMVASQCSLGWVYYMAFGQAMQQM